MSGSMIEVLPQPRVDVLVDALAGGRHRMTEYSGIVWFGGRPQPTGGMAISMSVGGRIESPFFLPDSLPYDATKLAGATLSITVALASLSDHINLYDQSARFVTDPSGRPTWIQVQVLAAGRVPVAFEYRVVALTAPDVLIAD